MKKNLLFLLLLNLFAFSGAIAQSRTVTGTVTGADDGKTIPGASVRVRGTSTGVSTDGNGKFSITVPEKAVLTISFIGYDNQERTVPATGILDVQLTPNNKQLTEVVVTGYGTGKKAADVVGNISQVTSKQLEDRPVANVLDALQGKVAGLQVLSSSGEPSATPSLSLHGLGSLGSGTTMLVILDGIQTDLGNVLSLNPNDIDNINVLKDASSTSIYGSKASNGVLVINTKKGQANRPATITISNQYSVNQIANTDFFNNFMNRDQFINFEVGSGLRSQAQINSIINALPVQNADTKWYKVYYKNNTPTYQGNVSISGGGDKTTYYVSGSYLKSTGLAYRSDYDRYTLRSNVTSNITNWLQYGVNIALANDDRQTNPYGSNSTNRGLGLLAAPYYSAVDPTGKAYISIPGWAHYSPQYIANENPDPNNKVQVNPSAYIQLTPIKGLTIKSQAGIDGYDYTETSERLPSYLGSINNGSVAQYFTRYVSKTFTNTAEYKFNVGDKHHFTALAGQEYNDASWSNFSGASTGQSDDRLTQLGLGPNGISVGSYKTDYAFESYFGRLDYDFNSKYFVEGSIRSDKSSLFGADHRTGTFWSAGANWKAKKEDFLKDVSWLDDLTIRASTGTQGNSDFGFSATGNVDDNYVSLATVSAPAYGSSNGFYFSSPGNSNLTWEVQHLTTFGLKASVFNALRLDLSYYIRSTSSMLINVPYPGTSGFTSVLLNTGTLQNKGLDIELEGDVWKDPAHKGYITPFIIANINHNKVTSLFQGKDYWVQPGTGVSWVIGQPVSFFYPIYKGVNSQTGAPEWYLPNATNPQQTRKDPNAVTSNFDTNALQQNTGISQYPWFQGSFGLRGGYEGFTLSASFNFVLGKHMINNDRYFYENPNVFVGYNQSTKVQNYWKKPGDVTEFPDVNNYQFTQFDSGLIENASFMRLKELTLGYSLPQSILSHTKAIKGVRIYAVGRNLFTITKYSGPDPEVDSNLSLGTYPNTKQYSLGLDVTF